MWDILKNPLRIVVSVQPQKGWVKVKVKVLSKLSWGRNCRHVKVSANWLHHTPILQWFDSIYENHFDHKGKLFVLMWSSFACCWSNALGTAIRWILLEWFWTQCTSRLNARLERTSSHFSSGCCWASAVNMRLQLARAFNLRHLRGNCLLGKFANVDQPTNRSF